MAEAVILLFKDKLRLNIPGCHILVQAASVEAKLAIVFTDFFLFLLFADISIPEKIKLFKKKIDIPFSYAKI